jgi:type IV pilus assembly protein PilW
MNRKRMHGFSLVSLMVGLFVGLLVMLAVQGSAAFFETNRRQMISGNAAFENALGGLLAVQRAAKQAGLSLAMEGRLACRTVNIYRGGAALADGQQIPPVRIIDGNDDSDTITIAFADSIQAAMPAQSVRPMAAGSSEIMVANALGLNVGDLVMVGMPSAGTPCTLMQISALATSVSPPGIEISHAGVTDWNPADRTATFTTMPSYGTGSLVQRIGNWNWLTYRIVDQRLEEVDNLTGSVDVVAEDVVYMKAAYGTTSGTGRTIEQWAPPTGGWANPSVLQFDAVRAIHIGVVARNPQRVKPSVAGGACDATANATVTLWPLGPQVDLSRLGSDWACYHYRTLTLAVPLRNVIFGDDS